MCALVVSRCKYWGIEHGGGVPQGTCWCVWCTQCSSSLLQVVAAPVDRTPTVQLIHTTCTTHVCGIRVVHVVQVLVVGTQVKVKVECKK